MKSIFKRICAAFLLMTLFVTIIPTGALAASYNGYSIGDTINTTKGSYRVSRGRGGYVTKYYTATKDVLNSVSKVTNKHDHYISTAWAKTGKYTITKGESETISLTASSDLKLSKTLAGKLGFSKSFAQSSSLSFSINANSAKYNRLAMRADFYKVTYTHYTYNKYGTQTGKSIRTFYAPIKNTAEYYIAYQ